MGWLATVCAICMDAFLIEVVWLLRQYPGCIWDVDFTM